MLFNVLDRPHPPAVRIFEINVDSDPVFHGTEDTSVGTDLCGAVILDLQDTLTVDHLFVSFQGISTQAKDTSASGSSSGSTSSSNAPHLIHTDEKELWHAPSSTQNLPAGLSEWRFMFKVPGHLPPTQPGSVEYVVKAIFHGNGTTSAIESSSSTDSTETIETFREVWVTRIVQGEQDGPPAFEGPPDWTPAPPPPPSDEPPAYE